jgi:hypothetical protein
MNIDKQKIVTLIIDQLRADLLISEQAVKIARDTATHSDCLGSSKYETMGLEASYLAQGQGARLLDIERSLACFKQLILNEPAAVIGLSSLILLNDKQRDQQLLWLAADAGGLKVQYAEQVITVITAKSPLGKAMIGKAAGDDFEISIAGKQRYYEISAVY